MKPGLPKPQWRQHLEEAGWYLLFLAVVLLLAPVVDSAVHLAEEWAGRPLLQPVLRALGCVMVAWLLFLLRAGWRQGRVKKRRGGDWEKR